MIFMPAMFIYLCWYYNITPKTQMFNIHIFFKIIMISSITKDLKKIPVGGLPDNDTNDMV